MDFGLFFLDELVRRHAMYRDEARAAGRSEAEIERLTRQSWGMRVVHVSPTRDEALRATEAPFMGYQRRIATLRSEGLGGSLPDSFDRSLVRLRPFRDYLDEGAGDDRVARRGARAAAGVPRRHRLSITCCS